MVAKGGRVINELVTEISAVLGKFSDWTRFDKSENLTLERLDYPGVYLLAMDPMIPRNSGVNGDPNPPLHGDALFSGMKNASRQKAQEPGQGQAAVFCGLA